jgi:hypothetical protein
MLRYFRGKTSTPKVTPETVPEAVSAPEPEVVSSHETVSASETVPEPETVSETVSETASREVDEPVTYKGKNYIIRRVISPNTRGYIIMYNVNNKITFDFVRSSENDLKKGNGLKLDIDSDNDNKVTSFRRFIRDNDKGKLRGVLWDIIEAKPETRYVLVNTLSFPISLPIIVDDEQLRNDSSGGRRKTKRYRIKSRHRHHKKSTRRHNKKTTRRHRNRK